MPAPPIRRTPAPRWRRSATICPARTFASARTAPAMAIDNAAYLSSFPDSRSVTPVAAQADQDASLPQQAPIFRSLFQAGERSQPISPAVQELWGNPSSLTRSRQQPDRLASIPRAGSACARPARSLQRSLRHVQRLSPCFPNDALEGNRAIDASKRCRRLRPAIDICGFLVGGRRGSSEASPATSRASGYCPLVR